MEREFPIHGAGLSPEIEHMIRDLLHEHREQGKNKVEGEIEKTDSDIRAMVVVNYLVQQLLVDLNLRKRIELEKPVIEPEQVHLLPSETFHTMFPDAKRSGAVHDSNSRAVFVNGDSSALPWTRFHVLLHETLHAVGFEAFRASVDTPSFSTYRNGYVVHEVSDEGQNEGELFRGFNEGFVDLMTSQLVSRNEEFIRRACEIQEERKMRFAEGYAQFIAVVLKIMNKVAQRTGRQVSDVLASYERSYFTGNMLHMREIEKTFGRHSLRVLAELGRNPSSSQDRMEESEKNGKILRYFDAEDKQERALIASEILGSTAEQSNDAK